MTGHLSQDALLDLAYGELSPSDAAEANAHATGCAECSRTLGDIRGVRRLMATLPAESEPAGGRDSLLEYAAQAAARRATNPGPARGRSGSRWGRYFAVLGSAVTLAVVGVLALQVQKRTDPGLFGPALTTVRNPVVSAAPTVALAPPPAGARSRGAPPAEMAKDRKSFDEDGARAAAQAKAPVDDSATDALVRSGERGAGSEQKGVGEERRAKKEARADFIEGVGVGGVATGAGRKSDIREAENVAGAGGADADKLEERVASAAGHAMASRSEAPSSAAAPALPAASAPKPVGVAQNSQNNQALQNQVLKQLDSRVELARKEKSAGGAPAAGMLEAAPLADSTVRSDSPAKSAPAPGSEDRVTALQKQLAETRGPAREPLLDALCDAQVDAQRWQGAEDACGQLLREFPGSRHGPSAMRRLVGARSNLQNRPAGAAPIPLTPVPH